MPGRSTARDLQHTSMDLQPDLGGLFHRLNNQLGIILANAELLESRAADEAARARASQVVESVLEAMGTVRELRVALEAATGSGRDLP